MKHILNSICLGALLALLSSAAFAASPDDPAKIKPLAVGSMAPAFTVREADGAPYRFTPDKLVKPTLLVFYRGGWCPYCNAHLKDLRSVVPKLSAEGFDVLFFSTDRPEILHSSLREPMDYHLLSDNEVNAARAFGIAYRLDDATYAKYLTYGLDLEQTQGAKHHELPAPAVIVIDRKGKIRYLHASEDYKVRLSAAEVLQAAQTVAAGK